MFRVRGTCLALLIASVAALSGCSVYERDLLQPGDSGAPSARDDGGGLNLPDGASLPLPTDGGSPGDAGGDVDPPAASADASAGCSLNPDSTECPERCPETCNALDDDCDGRTDEGEAHDACAAEHTEALCREGECLIVGCQDAYRDCDRRADNGCETQPDDPEHCGRCGVVCDLPNAIEACEEGECVAIGCEDAAGDCDGDRLSCETSLRSLVDCGGCGEPCGGLDNASPQCDSGSCGVRECLGNFGDCDGEADNGCETPLDSLTNCAGCATPCNKASCIGGVCTAVVCADPTADCNADGADCETDLSNDPANCGGCRLACQFRSATPRASLACSGKRCTAQCETDYGDCDEDYASGCETPLRSTPQHCGACGRNCTALLSHTAVTGCSNAACTVATCASGWGDCDADPANGCERNTSVEGPCFPDTNCVKRSFGTHDYFFCTNAGNWSTARGKCRAQARGDLVSIGSAAENAFVQSLRTSDAWIGPRDPSVEGLWRWENNGVPFWRGLANGSAISGRYENWANNQPDDYESAEDCAEILTDGTWNDQGCGVSRPFVCEQSPDECPSNGSKYDPGQCGCGAADTDTDGDGFADCVEDCDADANKQAAGVCGCGVSDADSDADGTPDCNDNCPADPTQTAPCLTFAPTNFDPKPINFGAQPNTTLNCGTTTINTADPDGSGPLIATLTNWCGTEPVLRAQTQASGPEAVIVPLRGLTLPSGYTLRLIGPRPVIFAVDGNVTLGGVVDADASGTTAGAGGNWSCGASQGTDGSGNNSTGAGGGGGGGFGSAGGNGGDGGGGSRGSAGATRGNTTLSPLFGGCGGGRGGGCSNAAAAGGGAVQLSASGTLSITGTIRANGGVGSDGCGSEGGGTGGGSGGAIFLEATSLSITSATLQTNGGRSGAGAGGPGGANGSTSSSSAGSTGGASGSNGGAGGGGGYGRVRTLTR